jgi:CDP-diacylglycerol--serine O-phosphatidyltransferase
MHVSFLKVNIPFPITRLIWAIGALYFSCAAIRLARFNVSNEHGEQHHFSFLGLPSPGAGGAIAAWVLMQQDLAQNNNRFAQILSLVCLCLLPAIVLITGLLMVSTIRYPHMVNRYLRGRQPVMKLLAGVSCVLILVVWHQYALGIGMQVYALYGIAMWLYGRARRRHVPPLAA